MKSRKLFAFAILSFILAWFSLHFSLTNTHLNKETNSKIIYILPERLRSFIAARLWEKADRRMHLGPVVPGQNFLAGSYAGNTDIIPYLKMVIALCPEEVAPYRLLASNYAYHLKMEDEAINIYKDAISNCSKTPFLHEIYASLAFIHLFSLKRQNPDFNKKELILANECIDKAIESYQENKDKQDLVFKKDNYYTIKARILWELEQPDQALQSWQMSGINLENSQDKLALLLLKYKETGVYVKFDFSNIGLDKNKSDNHHHHHESEHNHNDDHSINNNHIIDNQKSLLQAFLITMLKAGLIAGITILLYFLCSKSFGTGFSSFRFFAGK